MHLYDKSPHDIKKFFWTKGVYQEHFQSVSGQALSCLNSPLTLGYFFSIQSILSHIVVESTMDVLDSLLGETPHGVWTSVPARKTQISIQVEFGLLNEKHARNQSIYSFKEVKQSCFPRKNRVGIAYNPGQPHVLWIFSWPNTSLNHVYGREFWKCLTDSWGWGLHLWRQASIISVSFFGVRENNSYHKEQVFHPDSTSNLVGQMFQKCYFFFSFACHGIAKRRHVFWGKNLILYLDKAFN